MTQKYFIRRVIAYGIVDFAIVSILFALIAVLLGYILGVKIMAPDYVRSIYCNKSEIVSIQRMDALLPEKVGTERTQSICNYTTMGITTYQFIRLSRSTTDNDSKHTVYVSYPVNKNGEKISIYDSSPLAMLFAPYLFALFISKRGATPGKALLGLHVAGNERFTPDLRSAIKREYFKAIPFLLFIPYNLYTQFQQNTVDIETQAKQLEQLLSDAPDLSPFTLFSPLGLIIAGLASIALFWFHFGSFIKWRGQSYWDRYANTKVFLSIER